jgi:hypothetical protein
MYLIQGKTTFTSHEVRALRSSIPTKNIKKYLLKRHNWDGKIFKSIAWEAYASAIRSLDANMHKFVVKLCDNWLSVGQRLIKYGNTYDHCFLCSCRQHESYDHVFCWQSRNKWRDSFLSSLDEEMKKWLTAADIWREIVTGLKAWFEQTDNTLEAAASEDAGEVAICMVKDKDDPDDSDNDSDYSSIDAERDTQDDNDDERSPHPKIKVPPPTSGLTSFEAISIRVGLIAKQSSTETEDTRNKGTKASHGHPSLSCCNGRNPTRSGSNDVRNYTPQRTELYSLLVYANKFKTASSDFVKFPDSEDKCPLKGSVAVHGVLRCAVTRSSTATWRSWKVLAAEVLMVPFCCKFTM